MFVHDIDEVISTAMVLLLQGVYQLYAQKKQNKHIQSQPTQTCPYLTPTFILLGYNTPI